MLSGLIPHDGTENGELERRLLAGRYGEVRMLYFLGKDVLRWVGQCVEWTQRQPTMADAGLCGQSFVTLLISSTPAPVKEKLTRWGVVDFTSIFSRAVGLNAVFAGPPEFEGLSEEFLRNYHRYADALYRSYIGLQPHRPLSCEQFRFELYASGEYSRILESQWNGE